MRKGMFLFGGKGIGFLFVRRKIADAYAEVIDRTLKFAFETKRKLSFAFYLVNNLKLRFEKIDKLILKQSIERATKLNFSIIKKLKLK
jgi:hypothetical protein